MVPKQRLQHNFCQYVTPVGYVNQESKLGPFLLMLYVYELWHYHTGFAIAYECLLTLQKNWELIYPQHMAKTYKQIFMSFKDGQATRS